MDWRFDDFTDDNYRRLLKLAKPGRCFIGYDELNAPGRVCLWRHDVDFSMHRAARMAAMEAEEGIRATYFVLVRGNFYSVLEAPVTQMLRDIVAAGHQIGLHFDPSRYDGLDPGAADKRVRWEADLLANLAETPVLSMCYHVPDQAGMLDTGADSVGGLVNAHGRAVRDRFVYCSDSNGYWRFQRLEDVLLVPDIERLHVLTHPCLWTPEPMAPRCRIARCINGRADAQARSYDAILAAHGRVNVRDAEGFLGRLFERDPELCRLVEFLLARRRHDLVVAALAPSGMGDVDFTRQLVDKERADG